MNAQQANALEHANARRRALSRFRAELHDLPYDEARAELADLLESDDPGLLAAARIDALLRAIPRLGPLTADAMLEEAGISASHLGSITPLRRQRLAGLLRDGAPTVGNNGNTRGQGRLVEAAPLAEWLAQQFTNAEAAGRWLQCDARAVRRIYRERKVTVTLVERVLTYAPVLPQDLYPDLYD